jgi:hypothetical protein
MRSIHYFSYSTIAENLVCLEKRIATDIPIFSYKAETLPRRVLHAG